MLRLALSIFRYFPHGGLQRDFRALLDSALKRGHHVDIFTQKFEGKVPEGATLHLIKKRGMTNHRQAWNFSQTLQQLPKNTYDAVIGFNKTAGLTLYFAGDNCLSGTLAWYKKYLPRYRTYLALENKVFQPAATTHICVLTPQQQQAYHQQYHTPLSRFTLLAPSVHPAFQFAENKLSQRAAWRAEFGVGDKDYFLLMVASYFRTKGVDRALQTLAALPIALRQRCHLFIVGGDNLQPFLRQLQKYALAPHVHFVGAQEDVLPFYLSADVFIHPAYQEAAGQVLLEALCCGLPILTTENCGYSYHIREANAGNVLNKNWPLAESITALTNLLAINRQTWFHRLMPYKKHFSFQRGEQLMNLIEEQV